MEKEVLKEPKPLANSSYRRAHAWMYTWMYTLKPYHAVRQRLYRKTERNEE